MYIHPMCSNTRRWGRLAGRLGRSRSPLPGRLRPSRAGLPCLLVVFIYKYISIKIQQFTSIHIAIYNKVIRHFDVIYSNLYQLISIYSNLYADGTMPS